MNKIVGVSAIAATAYYALSLLVFMNREVEGSAFARFIRMFVVAYYGFMSCVYLTHKMAYTNEAPPDTEQSTEAASS
jgi:hypothetical protein